MTKDHTQLAIENGATIYYPNEILSPDVQLISFTKDALNATIEAAIKQAFDEAEIEGYLAKHASGDMELCFIPYSVNSYVTSCIPLIAKRVDK
jgi:hypothetical protein